MTERREQFARYVLVGVVTVGVDLTGFQSALALSAPRWVAVCVGFSAASLAQFSLNRCWSFRAFDRAMHEQFARYMVVTACTWLLTLIGVEALVRGLHFPALLAKLTMIPLTLPIGFLASRHVIFSAVK